MRKLSGAAVAMILAIALYFTLFWGFDALRILTSPTYGLEDVWRSQFVFAIGGLFGLSPIGLLKLAAFFGALKLAVAGICAVHILDRLGALVGGKADSEVLEGGLIPSRTPVTSQPYLKMAVFVTARMTALRPGASPPPERTPMRIETSN